MPNFDTHKRSNFGTDYNLICFNAKKNVSLEKLTYKMQSKA